jgi:hypothetical protein
VKKNYNCEEGGMGKSIDMFHIKLSKRHRLMELQTQGMYRVTEEWKNTKVAR